MNRRQFLRTAPVVAGAIAVPALAEPKPVTPDERIEAAVEEIMSACREIWQDCPIIVTDVFDTDRRSILIACNVERDPGTVLHRRLGTARASS